LQCLWVVSEDVVDCDDALGHIRGTGNVCECEETRLASLLDTVNSVMAEIGPQEEAFIQVLYSPSSS
jgi:hypothetical protein